MWPPPRRSFVGDQKPKPTALPADNHAGRLRRIAPCGARAESRWLAAREHEAALVEIPEQPDRAGPSGCEAAHCCDAARNLGTRRSRSPASSYCTAAGRDSSDWDVWAFRAKLHLRSGTPCLVLEFSMAQTGSVFARDAYLHQSLLTSVGPTGFLAFAPAFAGTNWADVNRRIIQNCPHGRGRVLSSPACLVPAFPA